MQNRPQENVAHLGPGAAVRRTDDGSRRLRRRGCLSSGSERLWVELRAVRPGVTGDADAHGLVVRVRPASVGRVRE
jgi:hypothetical protein